MIYDISLPIATGMLNWPGDPEVLVERVLSLDAGDGANVHRLSLGTHTGTHIDAPSHLLPKGPAMDGLELSALIGRAYVAHLPRAECIGPAELESLRLPEGCKRLLFRTSNSDRGLLLKSKLDETYVAFSAEAGSWLVDRGVHLVGIDALSVDIYSQASGPVHTTLLAAGVVILEGLVLGGVAAGIYDLVCLPLHLLGVDGAPARAILIQGDAGEVATD